MARVRQHKTPNRIAYQLSRTQIDPIFISSLGNDDHASVPRSEVVLGRVDEIRGERDVVIDWYDRQKSYFLLLKLTVIRNDTREMRCLTIESNVHLYPFRL